MLPRKAGRPVYLRGCKVVASLTTLERKLKAVQVPCSSFSPLTAITAAGTSSVGAAYPMLLVQGAHSLNSLGGARAAGVSSRLAVTLWVTDR